MQILLLGASGRTGGCIIQQALHQGHTVTALVRSEASIQPRGGLTIIKGSPLVQADIESAITASGTTLPSAVVVALASVRTSDSPFAAPVSPPRLMTDSHRNVIAAMKRHGIMKLVTVSGFGVGDSKSSVFFPVRMLLYHSNIGVGYADHNKVEKEVRASGLDWVLVRPVMFNDGPKAEVKTFGNQGKGVGLNPNISRSSVATFVVNAISASTYDGQTPVIAS